MICSFVISKIFYFIMLAVLVFIHYTYTYSQSIVVLIAALTHIYKSLQCMAISNGHMSYSPLISISYWTTHPYQTINLQQTDKQIGIQKVPLLWFLKWCHLPTMPFIYSCNVRTKATNSDGPADAETKT